MKIKTKTTARILAWLVLLVCIAALTACGREVPSGLWENAVYQKDTTLGAGETTLTFAVEAGDKTVTFTVKTDKTIVGDALQDAGLIDGEEGPYGLYVKVVNGITADFDTDGAYWCFYIDGQMAMTGADTTEITAGAVYSFVYTK